MPELPEVERAARALRRIALGRRIDVAELFHPALQRRVSVHDVKSLAGRQIIGVEQQAKHQRILLDDGRSLHVHFRMAGDWHFDTIADPVARHARAIFSLDDGGRISLVDPRALSTIALLDSSDDPFAKLGPDPFTPAFSAEWLRTALQRRRGAIKPGLLDQAVVAGMGNIYAAEALWEALISPRVRASSLSMRRCGALVDGIRVALRRGRGTRARYSDGGAGRFRVYDREGEPCSRCGKTIKRITQAGRSTYYCPKCQAR